MAKGSFAELGQELRGSRSETRMTTHAAYDYVVNPRLLAW